MFVEVIVSFVCWKITAFASERDVVQTTNIHCSIMSVTRFVVFTFPIVRSKRKTKKPCYNISIVVVTFAAQSIEVVRRIALRAAQEKQEGRGRGESVQEGIEEE